MTIEEKRKALECFCEKRPQCEGCKLHTPNYNCGRGSYFTTPEGDEGYMENFEIDKAYAAIFLNDLPQKPHILDSGNRQQFYDADGNPMAVRDIQEGKGRCDLLPLDVVA